MNDTAKKLEGGMIGLTVLGLIISLAGSILGFKRNDILLKEAAENAVKKANH